MENDQVYQKLSHDLMILLKKGEIWAPNQTDPRAFCQRDVHTPHQNQQKISVISNKYEANYEPNHKRSDIGMTCYSAAKRPCSNPTCWSWSSLAPTPQEELLAPSWPSWTCHTSGDGVRSSSATYQTYHQSTSGNEMQRPHAMLSQHVHTCVWMCI